MNMFKETNTKTIKDYINAVPEDRQATIKSLDSFIRKTVPELKPYFANNMLGYGSFPYKDYKKRDITWPTVAMANQKNYVSVYVCSIVDGVYAAELSKDKLGKVSVGKSCIRFKKLEDVNLDELAKVLKLAASNPGL